MTATNIKTAWRSITRRKLLSGVHIIGLAIAISTATLLYLTARYELSFDKFVEDHERIGLVYLKTQPQDGVQNNATFSAPIAPLLKAELPGITHVSRYYNGGIFLRNGDKQLQTNNKFVDPDFLSIFSLPLLHGDNQALKGLDNIVLDDYAARNLFHSTDVVGKQVEVNIGGQWQSKTIAAVMEHTPSNSSLSLNSLLRFEQKPDYLVTKDDWSHEDHAIFVKVASAGLDDNTFSQAARPFLKQYYNDSRNMLERDGAHADVHGDYVSMHLLPFDDYHLNNLGLGNGGSPTFPWILLLIAGLILFVACSNFINLSLAASLARNREIGTRKTLGSTFFQLVRQLWTEAFVLCWLALLLGVGLALLILPEYNASMNYKLSISQLFIPGNLLFFTAAFLVLTFIAGGYPAWRIARTNIIQNLKDTTNIKAGLLRNSLTVLQFSIAIALIVSTVVISTQLHYLTNRPLGFDKSEVISIPIGSGIDREGALDQMRIQLTNLLWVQGVSASDMNIGRGRDGGMASSQFGFEFEEHQVHTHFMRVDYDFLQTLGIKLVAGRDFDRSFSTDTNAVLVNKQMAEQLGGADKILGKSIPMDGNPVAVGIIDDFIFEDLRTKVAPLTLSINPHIFPVEYIFVRVKTDNLAESINRVEQIWKTVNPGANVSPSYLDENTNNLYRTERRFSHIVIGGASVAIAISCLGLFALTLLTVTRRIKEIGIRKVLGASVVGIVGLLSKDFLKLIGVAVLIASPIAWWAMSNWLDDFAYHIDIQWWMFALAGSVALLIALLTIGWQAIRAAIANPVESLRDE